LVVVQNTAVGPSTRFSTVVGMPLPRSRTVVETTSSLSLMRLRMA